MPSTPPTPPKTAYHTLPSGRTLWTEILGTTGPPILFANGMASTTNTWHPLLPSLPQSLITTHTLIFYDSANTGKSPYQPHLPRPTLSSLASEARALLELLGYSSGNFVGHSWGAQQALWAATQDPHFWKGMLCIAPVIDRASKDGRAGMVAIKNIIAANPEGAEFAEAGVAFCIGPRLRAKNAVYAAFFREMAMRMRGQVLVDAHDALLEGYDAEWRWEGVKARIVLLYGGEDPVSEVAGGKGLVERLRGKGVDVEMVVEGEGEHWLHWMCEGRVVEYLLDLAKRGDKIGGKWIAFDLK